RHIRQLAFWAGRARIYHRRNGRSLWFKRGRWNRVQSLSGLRFRGRGPIQPHLLEPQRRPIRNPDGPLGLFVLTSLTGEYYCRNDRDLSSLIFFSSCSSHCNEPASSNHRSRQFDRVLRSERWPPNKHAPECALSQRIALYLGDNSLLRLRPPFLRHSFGLRPKIK